MKTKSFEFPFIGYDNGAEHGWKMDVLIGTYGNPVIDILPTLIDMNNFILF